MVITSIWTKNGEMERKPAWDVWPRWRLISGFRVVSRPRFCFCFRGALSAIQTLRILNCWLMPTILFIYPLVAKSRISRTGEHQQNTTTLMASEARMKTLSLVHKAICLLFMAVWVSNQVPDILYGVIQIHLKWSLFFWRSLIVYIFSFQQVANCNHFCTSQICILNY